MIIGIDMPAGGGTAGAERDREVADYVERLVARNHRVGMAELRAVGRPTARVARARHLAMYLQRVLLQLSCEEIGRRYGQHRTSVSHACRKVEELRDRKFFDRRVQRLEDRIGMVLHPGRLH